MLEGAEHFTETGYLSGSPEWLWGCIGPAGWRLSMRWSCCRGELCPSRHMQKRQRPKHVLSRHCPVSRYRWAWETVPALAQRADGQGHV